MFLNNIPVNKIFGVLVVACYIKAPFLYKMQTHINIINVSWHVICAHSLL